MYFLSSSICDLGQALPADYTSIGGDLQSARGGLRRSPHTTSKAPTTDRRLLLAEFRFYRSYQVLYHNACLGSTGLAMAEPCPVRKGVCQDIPLEMAFLMFWISRGEVDELLLQQSTRDVCMGFPRTRGKRTGPGEGGRITATRTYVLITWRWTGPFGRVK